MERRSNPSYRKFRRAAYLLVAAVVVYTAFCHAVNSIVIPRVIIPKMREYLESGVAKPIKMSIGDIRFDPASGFLFKDVRLYTKEGSPADYIVYSKTVDIDLAWHELLLKRVTIRRFDMTDTDLKISRNGSGSWNIGPLAGIDFGKSAEAEFGGFRISVKEFRLLGGTVRYSDRMMPENSMERTFEITNISLLGSNDGSCKLAFLARSTGTKGDSLSLSLAYSGKRSSGEGNIRIRTANINDYWGYYLDDIMKPWKFGAENADLRADISFTADKLRMSSACDLKKGELDYGDLRITADAAIKHELEYGPARGRTSASAELVLKGMQVCAGETALLSNGECRAYIDGEGVEISSLEGQLLKKPVSYKGMFVFGEPRRLSIEGQVCGIRNTLDMKISGLDKADSELQLFTSYSKLTVTAESEDLKDLTFDIKMAGDVDLSDMGGTIGLVRREMTGKASVSGVLSGELDRAESFNGRAKIDINGFAFLDMEPKSFSMQGTVKDGIFDGEIPKFPIYGGTASAGIRLETVLSPQRWGFEIDLEKCDLKFLSGDDGRFSGMKGNLDANIACSGVLGRPETATGGGYIKVTDCSIKGTPIFTEIEKGMDSVIKDFSMPDFKEIKASFNVAEKQVEMKSDCGAPMLNIEMSGNCDFSGNVEMTAGVNVSRLNPIKYVRQILIPVTLGFDFVKDGILIKISGKWPELKQQTVIKPLRVFDELFGFMKSIDMRRYSLDETWAQVVESSK